jgi:carbonic anhydrase/acetyltransferase-like protein (isoleucine patch superfamily)
MHGKSAIVLALEEDARVGLIPWSSIDPQRWVGVVESYTLRRINGHFPVIAPNVYIADGARIIGQVDLKAGASVWFNAVLRADSEPITIGLRSNIQDNCTMHVDAGYPCRIGSHVTIGHNAVIHGCTIEDNVLVGMHATILNGATIGRDSIVGANALVTENSRIPPGSLVVGIPGRVARQLRAEEIDGIRASSEHYAERAEVYRGERGSSLAGTGCVEGG